MQKWTQAWGEKRQEILRAHNTPNKNQNNCPKHTMGETTEENPPPNHIEYTAYILHRRNNYTEKIRKLIHTHTQENPPGLYTLKENEHREITHNAPSLQKQDKNTTPNNKNGKQENARKNQTSTNALHVHTKGWRNIILTCAGK